MLDLAQSRVFESHRACKNSPERSAPPVRNAQHPRAGPVEEMGRPGRQHPGCARDVALVSHCWQSFSNRCRLHLSLKKTLLSRWPWSSSSLR